jgi:hypothetical protein
MTLVGELGTQLGNGVSDSFNYALLKVAEGAQILDVSS